MHRSIFNEMKHWLGIPNTGHHTSEQVLATLGGAFSIAVVVFVTQRVLPDGGVFFITPSMAATALLIFAAPHSVFAQPWAVLAGHLLSALIGVTCARMLPSPIIAASAAVGLSIGVMHFCRCIHPPASATALGAVIGGSGIHDLGYGYALSPVGVNCLIILVTGYLYNLPFAWRRYPASLTKYRTAAENAAPDLPDEADIEAAMDRLNLVIDTTPEEIHEILGQAMDVRHERSRAPLEIGRYYANDLPGKEGAVRLIIEERPSDNPDFDLVVYRTVQGSGIYRTGRCTRREFLDWMGSERSAGKR